MNSFWILLSHPSLPHPKRVLLRAGEKLKLAGTNFIEATRDGVSGELSYPWAMEWAPHQVQLQVQDCPDLRFEKNWNDRAKEWGLPALLLMALVAIVSFYSPSQVEEVKKDELVKKIAAAPRLRLDLPKGNPAPLLGEPGSSASAPKMENTSEAPKASAWGKALASAKSFAKSAVGAAAPSAGPAAVTGSSGDAWGKAKAWSVGKEGALASAGLGTGKGNGGSARGSLSGSALGSGQGFFGGEEDLFLEEGLSRDEVGRVIHAHREEIQFCYESSLLKNPHVQGKLLMKFTVSSSGQVSTTQVVESEVGSFMEKCLQEKLKAWNFPKPKGGVTVAVQYPFLFKNIQR